MIYNKLNAHDAYAAGLKTRIDQKAECGPMRCSEYKLLECRRNFYHTQKGLAQIGEYVRSKSTDFRFFNHCTNEDQSLWVKTVTAGMCHSLGRDLVGVLHGLAGDRVSENDLNNIEAAAQRHIPRLLDLGEAARIETQRHWRQICKRLGTGQCVLDVFVEECIELIDDLMDAVNIATQKTPSAPSSNLANERQKIIEECRNDFFDF